MVTTTTPSQPAGHRAPRGRPAGRNAQRKRNEKVTRTMEKWTMGISGRILAAQTTYGWNSLVHLGSKMCMYVCHQNYDLTSISFEHFSAHSSSFEGSSSHHHQVPPPSQNPDGGPLPCQGGPTKIRSSESIFPNVFKSYCGSKVDHNQPKNFSSNLEQGRFSDSFLNPPPQVGRERAPKTSQSI